MSTLPGESLTLEHIEQLVNELRSAYEDLLNGETIAAPAQIRAIVVEWTTKVLPAVDSRITRCHELVKRGLRTEGIDYALEPPCLFEAVTLLNLEKRFGQANYHDWMGASRAAGLMPPAAPQLQKYAEIKAAKDRVNELQPLLEKWRRMNIQRVPLPKRIRMLRELNAQDKGTQEQVWHGLLRTHEAHRLMEIKAGLVRIREQLATQRSIDVAPLEQEIKSLLEELQDDWSTLHPPADVSDQGRGLLATVQERRADAAIDALVPKWESAYAGLATERAAAKTKLHGLLDEWNQALADRGVADPADTRFARVQAIVQYAEALRESERLTLEVDQLLSEPAATLRGRISWAETLDRLMDRIDDAASRLSFEDIDPNRVKALSGRVVTAAEAVQREVRLRTFLSVVAIAAAMVGIAATAWTVYASRQHRSGVNAAVTAANELVKRIEAGDDSRLDIAGEWSASVRRDPRVAAGLERATQALKNREQQKEAFTKHLADISSALEELSSFKRTGPLDPWPEAFSRAEIGRAHV